MLAALLITTMVTLPFDVMLKLIFQLLAAKSKREVELRTHAKQALMIGRNNKVGDASQDTAVSATADHVGALGRQGGRRGGFSLGRDLEKATDEKPGDAREKAEDGVSRAEPVLSSSVAVVGSRARAGPAALRRMSWRRVFTVVKLALKTPTVTKDIRVARSACLEMWVKLHEMGLYGASRGKFLARQQQEMLRISQKASHALQPLPSSSKKRQLTRTPSAAMVDAAVADQRRAAAARLAVLTQQLQHATHEEFGMTVLQSLYRDVLDQSTVIGQRFSGVMNKDFPIESYVSDVLHWSLTVFIVMLNMGALLYVVLRGTGRGVSWQRSLLQVCFLDWFIEVLVHQSFEVYFVHFLLPNLIYEDVQATMAALLRASASLVHETMRTRGTVAVGEVTLRTLYPGLAGKDADAADGKAMAKALERIMVTQQAILLAPIEKRALMESQLSLYFTSDRFFTAGETPRRQFVLPATMNVVVRRVWQVLFFIAG
eukprot:gene18134-21087_t